MEKMQAMIFAAGLGTRLKPLTDTMPKALVPLCGKPLLEHLLQKMEAAGVGRAVINIHHFAGMIREFVRQHPRPGMDIRFSDETDLLRDTGGGIRHALPLFDAQQPVLVHNADIVSNLDLRRFYAAHRPDSLATLLVSPRTSSRYLLFDGNGLLAGWMNTRTGEVRSPRPELRTILQPETTPETTPETVPETAPEQRPPLSLRGNRPEASATKPSGPQTSGLQTSGFHTSGLQISGTQQYGAQTGTERFLAEHGLTRYAFAGIHLVSPRMLRLLKEWPEEKFSIIDFYLAQAGRHPVRACLFPGLELADVGKADSLREAEERCRSGRFGFTAPTRSVPD